MGFLISLTPALFDKKPKMIWLCLSEKYDRERCIYFNDKNRDDGEKEKREGDK